MDSKFLNVVVYGNESDRLSEIIETIEYEDGKRSSQWLYKGAKNLSFTLGQEYPNIITKFIEIEEIDQIEEINDQDLDGINSAILLLDATEKNVKEDIGNQINVFRQSGDFDEILVLIMNAAPRKNDKGILSRRQAKYFITGLNKEYDVDLQYAEIDAEKTEDDYDIIWDFVTSCIDIHLQ